MLLLLWWLHLKGGEGIEEEGLAVKVNHKAIVILVDTHSFRKGERTKRLVGPALREVKGVEGSSQEESGTTTQLGKKGQDLNF
ncbi:hypothetical protein MRB53_016424 [Persea americana]|uniref:Uncharacterized protein n=1 Tax=Persea americana TaxID=3435 RepID=A0ACC2M247_PERAE|nr:hypothetical protein MRB53_016424 [Persea americana]